MSQNANLLTIRKNIYLNFSNTNNKIFLTCFHFLKMFKNLLLKKKIILTKETFNISGNKIFINGNLFFSTSVLKRYKKKFFKKTLFNIKIKKKNILFELILKKLKKQLKINSIASNFKILNKNLNKKMLIFLFRNFKGFIRSIFERRNNLFLDFIKVTNLYLISDFSLNDYCNTLAIIFSTLQKKSHSRFILFLKNVFNIIVYKLKQFESEKYFKNQYKGIKCIISGRLKGKTRASSIKVQSGIVPTQSISKKIEYAKSTSFTSNSGTFGFKIWVHKE